jgi:hypothetical protein
VDPCATIRGLYNFVALIRYRYKYGTLWMVSGMWIQAQLLESYKFVVLIRYRYKYIVDGVWHVDPSATV